MRASLEFFLGLLDREEPAHVSQDDLESRHGKALRLWRRMGFLSREAGMNPVASCPHCGEGVPYRVEDRYVCNRCRTATASTRAR